jgi:hypothetical protein
MIRQETSFQLCIITLNITCSVELEVLAAVVMKCSIFWAITPCSPLNVNRRFGRKYLNIQALLKLCLPHVFELVKLRLSLNGLQGVISQNTELSMTCEYGLHFPERPSSQVEFSVNLVVQTCISPLYIYLRLYRPCGPFFLVGWDLRHQVLRPLLAYCTAPNDRWG